MEIVYKKINELKPYENNSRTHDESQIKQICESIKEYGWTNPVLIDEKGMIIAGHGRVEAGKKLDIKEVPCIVLSGLTEAQKKAYVIADNKMALNAGWNEELLKTELEKLKELDFDLELTGFNIDELDELFKEDEEEQEIVEDDFDIEPPEEPKAKLGDIYQLGNHRLMCGDSTKLEDVEKLMNGNKADMVFTDPPYNVAYEGGSKKREMIKNDKMDNFYDFLYDTFTNCYLSMKDGSPIYVAHSELERINFTQAFIDSGFKMSSIIIWAKNNSTFSMNKDYKQKHEPIIYGWKQGGNHKWEGGNCEDTLWEIKRPSKSDLHPTMKPIELCARGIKNSSNVNDIVYEPFGGSGSTLMACEQTKRKCYTMELDPKYVDVIIKRWEDYTGKKAVLIESKEN